LDAVRARRGNRDLLASVAFYESADPSSRCVYGFCFRIRSSNLEQARQCALEVVYYLAENYGIPPESLDLIFNGGGLVAQDDGRANAGAAAPAEIVILVPPSVFGARPTPHALTIIYDLARQMSADGLHVDVDAYAKEQQFVWLPNTFNTDAGGYAVVIKADELLNLSSKAVGAISVRPRNDDSFAICRPVPEATEWFAETLAEKEKQARQQSQLRDKLIGRWVVPPCVRRLDWAEMSEDSVIEACRVIAAFYPFVGAGPDEVWYHIHRVSKRHGLLEGARLRAIVTFGGENPAFACGHPLLRLFCPSGGCFMKELIDDLRNPRLFT
ncbi:MAG TPA: hypothetical protein VLI39_02330, partial [Sedimentisphaerales bacterium]|nr:hypothetical protein [Sedimentisphaerales bacterium]